MRKPSAEGVISKMLSTKHQNNAVENAIYTMLAESLQVCSKPAEPQVKKMMEDYHRQLTKLIRQRKALLAEVYGDEKKAS